MRDMDNILLIGASGVLVLILMTVWTRHKQRNWNKTPMQMPERWMKEHLYRTGTRGSEPWNWP